MHTDSNTIEAQTIALLHGVNRAINEGFYSTALRFAARANGFYHGAKCPHGAGERCTALGVIEAQLMTAVLHGGGGVRVTQELLLETIGELQK